MNKEAGVSDEVFLPILDLLQKRDAGMIISWKTGICWQGKASVGQWSDNTSFICPLSACVPSTPEPEARTGDSGISQWPIALLQQPGPSPTPASSNLASSHMGSCLLPNSLSISGLYSTAHWNLGLVNLPFLLYLPGCRPESWLGLKKPLQLCWLLMTCTSFLTSCYAGPLQTRAVSYPPWIITNP